MRLSMAIGTSKDAVQIAVLRNEVAQDLTARFGKGHWSFQATEKGVLSGMKGKSKTLIVKNGTALVGTLLLTTKKPWAIDASYFTNVLHPLYLLNMAVKPGVQSKGIGKYMLQKIRPFAETAQAIRLDAYDSSVGAGDFYRKCGFSEMGRVVYRKTPLIYFEMLIQKR